MSEFSAPRGPVYTASFSATAVSAATDLFCLTAPSNSAVMIREIVVGQYSDAGDAEAEILSITLMAGSTAASGGSAVTPRNVERHAGALTAGSSVLGPSATVASTTSAELIYADVANVAAGWIYRPDVAERPILEPSERFALRVSAPSDEITMNGTITFEEVGAVST